MCLPLAEPADIDIGSPSALFAIALVYEEANLNLVDLSV
jgi:hypothetical protein